MRDELAKWLDRDDLVIEQVSGGSSNLTFRVRSGDDDWILRRPPLSHVLATANDMRREWTAQLALHGSAVPVPRVVRTCTDESVLGSPFYLMERLDGIVFNDASDVAHLTPAQAADCSHELVDVLARLHAVEPAAVGLSEFGRPVGFMQRQLRRWRTQWERSKRWERPEIDEIARRLDAALPPEGPAAIVHGDYSFNNTMFFRSPPTRMQALLDWEMSTLGDPFTDVGTLAVYWGRAGELMWRSREHPQPHRAGPGFPTTDELLERYAATSGRDLSTIGYYQAFACYKLAVIAEGARVRRAATPDQAPGDDAIVGELADLALATLPG
ncbi:phosphotransferase family protein [Frankia sp. AgKG'84/4]|uniref:phosphotransferase family protein n=1 Tax=Frankia sp. AgKG'84/4 TaxID=573490 RepID=UPI002010B7C2|nr:phosphotransferase family protein [Frankia sp. AgKG'84/4]MCL9793075.1 phosphotransferase family protein [Frankia sp. AgKG'84/4]